MRLSQGDIWFADFGEPVGAEQGFPRPALVLSNGRYNAAGFKLVIVAPLTTRDRGWSHHVEVPPQSTGLHKTSWVMPQQARAISPLRMECRLGRAPRTVVHEVLDLLERMF
ncbi:hypothetical protein Pth03_29130 [Planotetraspora thailandica]|uniref:mRNA interferase n=1 Tax=Planotetraspora thailandica TaxID=487172 RepID=A0A8J3V5S7_9ACTN|nr:type II toxin-antitoxin system PemK/MazF family toxin [Planotetraspora thailandica]GII54524.1 hypothetical protein Pth03_29130 [Planotetraspora thailandica]